jgi:hypothetical protein
VDSHIVEEALHEVIVGFFCSRRHGQVGVDHAASTLRSILIDPFFAEVGEDCETALFGDAEPCSFLYSFKISPR